MRRGNLVFGTQFISEYMQLMDPQETPKMFDFWCAVWLVGLAVGRDTVIPRPRAPVYFNNYILLVANSGVARKSTAIRVATDVARGFMEAVKDRRKIRLVEGKTSPEAMMLEMHRDAGEVGYVDTAISVSELVTFLGRERYTVQMPGLLTDLYDCPSLRRSPGTLTRGQTIYKNVYLNFLSATTPSQLLRTINADIVEGGFTSRTLICHAERRKRRIPWPAEGDDNAYITNLSNRLVGIYEKARGIQEIPLTDAARKLFESWYGRRRESRDPYLSSFESREDAHVLKVSGIFAISDDRWVIEHADIKRSFKVISRAKYEGQLIFDSLTRVDKVMIAVERIRDTLLHSGKKPMEQAKLYLRVRNYANKTIFDAILRIMHELEMVQQFENRTGERGRPAKLWRGTDLLVKSDTVEKVVYEYDND